MLWFMPSLILINILELYNSRKIHLLYLMCIYRNHFSWFSKSLANSQNWMKLQMKWANSKRIKCLSLLHFQVKIKILEKGKSDLVKVKFVSKSWDKIISIKTIISCCNKNLCFCIKVTSNLIKLSLWLCNACLSYALQYDSS